MSEYKGHLMEKVMDQIIDLRYTDLEKERQLCMELLYWAGGTKDAYASAFAHTYLGDYHIAQNNSEQAGVHLMTAKNLAEGLGHNSQLLLRMYSLLGMNYENIADEQNSVQYYLMAITIARESKDIFSECIILNNLAFAFQRYQNYEEAARYYREAYELQKSLEDLQYRTLLTSNLVELCLMQGQYEEALQYMSECLVYAENEQEYKMYESRNWCSYYCAVGDKNQASQWAEKFLEIKDYVSTNRLSANENFGMLCEGMIQIDDQAHAKAFLDLMEQTTDGNGLNQLQRLEEIKMKYILRYGSEQEVNAAYRNYFKKTQEFRSRINQNIVVAMKAKMHLEALVQQRDEMRSEYENLERQANVDELTNVYNRRYLEQMLQELSEKRERKLIGIIMLDVDYFKEYNDFYGHMMGDTVLKSIGSCLNRNRTGGIYPCRFGGDEFTCICYDLTDEEMGHYIEQIRMDLEREGIIHEKSRCGSHVTLSIGCAMETEKGQTDLRTLQQLADEALYEAKGKGRNTCIRKLVGSHGE